MRLEQEKTITALLTNDPALQPLEGELLRAHALLREAFSGGGKLLVCGNGGSAADSAHVVGELMKGFRKRRPLPACAPWVPMCCFWGWFPPRRLPIWCSVTTPMRG